MAVGIVVFVGWLNDNIHFHLSYFTGGFEPQQPGETMGEYLARRNTRVKQQMRGYMDSYYTPLRNPQYAAMSDEEKDNYIDSITGQGMATGGRVGYQTGGVTESRTLPPEYVEALGKTYAADLTRQAGMPTVTTATTQQPGETAQQFAQRQAQAQQFGITKAGMADLAPQVAAQDALQTQSYNLAGSGVGAYQPYLTQQAAYSGPQAYQGFASPYQQDVIDATLSNYDKQAQAGITTVSYTHLTLPTNREV